MSTNCIAADSLDWDPFSVEEVSALLCDNQDWFFVGGVSVDLYLGYKTRSHGDIDIGVFEPALPSLIEALQPTGLSVFTANKGHLTSFNAADINTGANNFWISDGSAYRLQLLTYPVRGEKVIFRRNKSISFPIKSFILSVGQHRIINPFVSVIFKATTMPQDKDLQDIANIMNSLQS